MKKIYYTLPILLTSLLMACHAPSKNTKQPAESLPNGTPLPEQDVPKLVNSLESGNAMATKMPQALVVKEDIYTSDYDPSPEVVRYGRYTLVTSSPEGGKKYLLDQIVNIDMRKNKGKSYPYMTVRQGMERTLEGTGYSLCHLASFDVKNLFALPLPHVHYNFGPTKLRDALQMLAGEAFELTLNAPIRQVCFNLRSVIPEQPKPQVQIEATANEFWMRRKNNENKIFNNRFGYCFLP